VYAIRTVHGHDAVRPQLDPATQVVQKTGSIMTELHVAPIDSRHVQTDANGNQLSRSMSLTNLVLLGVSAQIGSGWLFAVLSAAGATGSAAVLSWIFAAVFFGILAMPWMELGAMLPRSGGPVRYPSMSHGLFTGWIVGAAYWVAAVAVTTLEAQAVLTYLSNQWPSLGLMHTSLGIEVLTWPTGILAGVALLGVFTLLNIVGIRALSEANRWVTVWKIAIPAITFILLFTAFKSANFTAFGFASHGIGGILHAIPATGIAFAYLGFRQVLDFGGECRKPQRDIPIAIGLSILIPMVVYVLLQIAFIGALDWTAAGLNPGNWDGLLSSNWASAPLFEALITAGFGAFGTVLLIDAVASPAATGWVFMGSASRSTLALAENSMAPSGLRSLNRFHVPWLSLVVSFVASCLFLLPLPSWYKLVSVVSVALLLSYLIGSSTMAVLRRTAPGLHRPFRLRNVGLWAPLSFLATLVMIYVAGFATLVNLMTVVFLTLPVYSGYLAVRHGWVSRAVGAALSAGFVAMWAYINWAGGWFLSPSDTQRSGSWSTPTYLAVYAVVLAAAVAVIYATSSPDGRKPVARSIWFVVLMMAVLVVSYIGSYGPLDQPVLTEGWDIAVVALIGLPAYYWSVRSGYLTEDITDYLAEEEHKSPPTATA
jgi:amino acid transporter